MHYDSEAEARLAKSLDDLIEEAKNELSIVDIVWIVRALENRLTGAALENKGVPDSFDAQQRHGREVGAS